MSCYLVAKLLPKLLQELLPNSKAAAKPVMQQRKQKCLKRTLLDGSGSDVTADAEALEVGPFWVGAKAEVEAEAVKRYCFRFHS